MKEVYLKEYKNCCLFDLKKEFSSERKIALLEDHISIDKCDLYDNTIR